jgi:hypothetical protein
MSTTLAPELRLHEAAAPSGTTGPIQADGTVLVHIIRPCVGKGKGRHVYEADMLAKHGGHFTGWPMMVDHESPEAQRRAGGLPPSVWRIGGEILESWWDPNVPAEGRFGQGAIVGRVRPAPMIAELIEAFPRLVQTSINTHATGVRPTTKEGRPAYLVEGFASEGTVDWVTKAGAGGKVVQLMEAYYEDLDEDDDNELRPAVAEALINPAPEHGEEDDVKPEEIREAVHTELRSDDVQDLIRETVQEAVQETIAAVLPQAIGRAAEVIEAQATQATRRENRNMRLARRAVELIEAAKLPAAFQSDVSDRFREVDLDDDTDESGAVLKTAEAKLEEAVTNELSRARKLMESVNPTAVTGAGGGGEFAFANGGMPQPTPSWEHELAEAGIDPAQAWGVKLQENETTETAAA